jgi:uncharacterized protein (TIGR01777 family)
MKILITGASGSVAGMLATSLASKGHRITGVSRNPDTAILFAKQNYPCIPWRQLSPGYLLANQFNAIINLAGAPMIQRWNTRNKQAILQSRIHATQKICSLVRHLPVDRRPECILHASSTAIYANADEPVDEWTRPPKQSDFFQARVWNELETLQRQQRIPGVRNIITRLGIVIGPTDMLKTMLIASRCFMGSVLGSGRQRISWIAHRDMARAFDYLVQNRTCSGTYNLVSPECINARTMAMDIAASVNRAAILRIPDFLIHCMLGELASNFTISAEVRPRRLLDESFNWELASFNDATRTAVAELGFKARVKHVNARPQCQ